MSTSSSSKRCRQFSLKEIKEVTNQFESKFLGKGGEAMVYYAEIYTGSKKTPVAVKYLNAPKTQRDNTKEFESEIQTLAKIQHPNIVSLIGYCNESGQKILVYEYMEKGCLSDYLKKKKDKPLSWLQRLNICLDVARGLQHLHSETNEFPRGIIHRDVKPGNILVGENWVGKLSDFGIIKLSDAGQDKSTMTTDHKGTSGYFAPEYHKFGRVTRKIDVYAFGIVLFQVLCEKMPWDRADESYYYDENEDLGIWAQKNFDAQIRREMSGDSFTLFTDIIGRSLQGNPGKRPTMEKVVLDLEKVLLECQGSENQPKQLEDSPRGFEGITSKVYTLEEVSRHNKIDDFWRIIAGKVYDLTPFMDDHPGGDEVLLSSKKDATQDFEDVGHSDSAIEMMGKYYLGDAIVNTGGFEGITYKVYTLEEVSRHNKIDDFWRIISGKVYDLTPFMDDHPGGDEVLLSSKKDATQDFEDVGHSDSARDMMEKYYLGDAIVDTGGSKQKKKYWPF